MDSFELELDEQSRVGSEFMARVVNEIRRAVATEKSSRKLTQQAIADKIGTSRAVINRQIQGLENLSARRIAEILWAIGWEPYFEARRKPAGENLNLASHLEVAGLHRASASDQKTQAGATASALAASRTEPEKANDQRPISSAAKAAYAAPILEDA
jgi:transcriptional regulator with XRE-family HTH domain